MTQSKKNSGFTLIEIMVVILILGILATLIIPKILNRPEQARIVKAKQDVTSLQTALDLFKLDNGFYPTTDQGLQALVKAPTSAPRPLHWRAYLNNLPQDPWGQPYQYLNPGEHGTIDIFSYGPPSDTGTNVSTQEIGNWNTDKTDA